MRATRTAEQALRLATSTPSQQYICRACRAQAARQFHTSRPLLADEPFYKRLQRTLFGSKESRDAEKQRDEKQQRRVEELAERDNQGALETKTDKHGRTYEVAAIVDPTVNKEYVQSSTWDGLEQVGSEAWVQQRADRGEQYVGFMPKKRVELDSTQWAMLLHHVTVEALVLQKAGRDVEQVCWPRGEGSHGWMYTRGARVQPSVNGGVTVGFTQAEAEGLILQAIPLEAAEGQTLDEAALFGEVEGAVADGSSAEGESGKKNGFLPPAWMDVSLHDPRLKMAVCSPLYHHCICACCLLIRFQILKRTLQLTGKRLSDPSISTSSTLADLYHAFRTTKTPNQLAQAPQLKKLRVNAPNVTVHTRRQTPIDKDKAVGRWKIIEDELTSRDLPITGSRYQGAKVEVKYRGREVIAR